MVPKIIIASETLPSTCQRNLNFNRQCSFSFT